MTEKELKKIVDKLDRAKAELNDKGIAFSMVTMNTKTGEYDHVGIGTGADLSYLNVIQLYELYQNSTAPLDDFLDSVISAVKLYDENFRKGIEILKRPSEGLN